jgi:integrase
MTKRKNLSDKKIKGYKRRKKFTHISKENLTIIDKYVKYATIRKTLEKKSQRNIKTTLEKLADYLEKKSLKKATEEDLMSFFGNPEIMNQHNRSRSSYAVHIIPFYRWVEEIKGKSRPKNMEWFVHQSSSQARRYADPERKEKSLILPEDYEKIIQTSNDAYGQNKALWELMYLSGARPNEIAQLKIRDVQELPDGNYQIIIEEGTSKTVPRKIALPEQPYNLIRWMGNHPLRENKDTSLWFSLKTNEIIDTGNEEFINRRFTALKKKVPTIKQTLTPKCFRKTRGTILFNDSKYNDGNIGLWMGWTPQTVAQRRMEYDLTDYEDLKKKVFTKPKVSISYEALEKIKEEKESMVEKHEKQIQELNEKMRDIAYAMAYGQVITQLHMKEDQEKRLYPEAWKNYQDAIKKVNETYIIPNLQKKGIIKHKCNIIKDEKKEKSEKKQ